MIQVLEGNVAVSLYHLATAHDFAIPRVILEEAGGFCTDEKGNQIVFSNNFFDRTPYFFAFYDKEIMKEFFEFQNS